MAGILWLVLVVLLALWLIGLVANIGGGLIHLLLVVAVIVLLYNLLTSRRTCALTGPRFRVFRATRGLLYA